MITRSVENGRVNFVEKSLLQKQEKEDASCQLLIAYSVSPALVHFVQQRLARYEALHVVHNEPVVAFPQPVSHGGRMGSDQDVVQRPEGRVWRQRFFMEDIQGGAGDAAVLERVEQCGFIDQWSPGNIDEVSVELHFAQPRGVHDAGCCRSYRCAEENVVSLGQNIVNLRRAKDGISAVKPLCR